MQKSRIATMKAKNKDIQLDENWYKICKIKPAKIKCTGDDKIYTQTYKNLKQMLWSFMYLIIIVDC